MTLSKISLHTSFKSPLYELYRIWKLDDAGT